MPHTEETITEKIGPEPPDGTRLAVDRGDGDWRVIWRDDDAANRWHEPYGTDHEHWWHDPDGDPMGLYQHLKYAKAVYPLGKPVAVFEGR